MRLPVRSASGPWGNVRVEIRFEGGTYSVHTWINGQPQKPSVGLEKDEAAELADETLQARESELHAAWERAVTDDEVRAHLASVTTLTPIDKIGEITTYVNAAFRAFTKERKLVEAWRYLTNKRVEARLGVRHS